ncbi:MAG: pitrilysin family protein [Candidatus Saelkia tenebricola]|nr:pitrilysin family protein [Candidatus Saelkia tenebricola]
MEKMNSFYKDVKFTELDNGLGVLYKYYPGEIVGVSIFIGTGSADEEQFIGSGISHLMEHLVFEGRKDLEEELRKLGAISNAYTTLDHTLYYFEVPKENFKKSIEIFLSAIFNPSLEEDVFEREREVVLKEEKFRDDNPSSLVVKIGFEKSYVSHPYKYPILGESALLKQLTLGDINEFHGENYVPNNAVVSVVGGVDYSHVKEVIASYGSEFLPRCIRKGSFAKEKKNFHTQYTQNYPGNLVYSFISLSGVSLFDADSEALDLLSDYLSWGKDAPLYERFIESGICYSVSSLNYTPHSQGIFGFLAVLDEKNVDLFQDELKQILEQIKNGQFNDSRIERLKKRASFDFLKDQEMPLDIAQSLSRNEGLTGNYKFNAEYLRKYLQLNSEDLQRIAKKYLKIDISTEVLLVPEKEEKKNILNKKIDRKLEKIEYPNGLKLVLSNDDSSALTAVTVLFEGGVRAENEKINGISEIIPRVLITADIQKRFEELGGKISPVSGNNSIGFTVEVVQSGFKEVLKEIPGLLINPVFQADELDIQKNIQIGKIRDSQIDLFYQALEIIRASMYKKHPYRLMSQGTIESLSGLKVEDLNGFTDKFFTPSNCVISIAGDIDGSEVKEDVKKLLGNWKGEEFQILLQQDSYPESQITVSRKIPQQEVVVEMGFMVPEVTSNTRYHLDLIQALVSGQGSLFFNRIRREIGGAYALGGSMFLGPEPGVMSFYVATTPDKKDQVLDKMVAILNDLGDGNITEEEIEDAKAMLRTRYHRDIIANSSYSFRLAVNESLGLGYQEVEKYLDEIGGLTKNSLVEFIKKYLNPEKAVIVEVGNI